jgi:hypothetical protein
MEMAFRKYESPLEPWENKQKEKQEIFTFMVPGIINHKIE